MSLVPLEAVGEHDVDEHDQFLRVANQLANLVMLTSVRLVHVNLDKYQ